MVKSRRKEREPESHLDVVQRVRVSRPETGAISRTGGGRGVPQPPALRKAITQCPCLFLPLLLPSVFSPLPAFSISPLRAQL